MSYTPHEQRYELPIAELLDGIKKTDKMCEERLKYPDQWKHTHLEKLRDLRMSLLSMENKVLEIFPNG